MSARPIAARTPDPTAGPPCAPRGQFVTLDGEPHYRIAGYHRLPPFLMTLASDTDLWMFVTSGGGLTAGRADPDGALFPYETVDKLHDAHCHTGPITLIRIARPGEPPLLWQPFAPEPDDPRIERNLYKNVTGNRLVFEEIHGGLGLVFRYRWSGSDELGLVRTATLENRARSAVAATVLDGLRNVLPCGAPLALQQQASCLVDAYKRVDVDAATGLAIFSLTSRITDRAEAAEQLRANVVWRRGTDPWGVCLSLEAVAEFRRGADPAPEHVLTGRRGNYLAVSSHALEPGVRATWHVVADAGLSHLDLESLGTRLREDGRLGERIERSLEEAGENLRRIVAGADGIQLGGHPEATARHFANVLFNGMRGGVFAANHDVPTAALAGELRARNRAVAERHRAAIEALPARLPVGALHEFARASGDPDLARLCLEFLPLFFSRRHGDPSRPWNRFSIRRRSADGGGAPGYEGNWRDIFQNWEALAASFPGFLPGMVARFVDASTVDGFNPYRLTPEGAEWEVVDPRQAWGNIGYWGDHQIVYLLRFLEALGRCAPGTLEAMLGEEVFAYIEVPYRLKPFADILADPHATIVYDAALDAAIRERVAAGGTDGQLVRDASGDLHRVNLLEKLLVPALSKLSNFVPGGGVWMNTQRPEWNDANNALVGNGVSMVTLFALRRYLAFLEDLLARARAEARLSSEVAAWLRRIHEALRAHPVAESARDEARRMALLEALGAAFSSYRDEVYAGGFGGGRERVPAAEIAAFCRCALDHLDETIGGSRRADGLVHSYSLLEIAADRSWARIRPLGEMLEGQVAALASGVVGPDEAVKLVESLFASALYREEQRSFLLYPERELPPFLEKNRVPGDKVRAVPLLVRLLERGDGSILARDAEGTYRFHADLRNARDLAAGLERLAATGFPAEVARDREAVLALFEEVFRHGAFTGRSCAMYAYEGLGCVYWHMVSKLLLAVQEVALRAFREGAPARTRGALAASYHRIRSGLGFEKTVGEYGAFPIDPYSHTPARGGAQQPGMTGQVKEDILSRFGELGVRVEDGLLSFEPVLLRAREFLEQPATWRHYDLDGAPCASQLPARSLAFTYCGVPVVYRLCEGPGSIRVRRADGGCATIQGCRLDAATSRDALGRAGVIAGLDVLLPRSVLCRP